MAVDAHIAEAHWKTGVTNLETGEQLICRICEEGFTNKDRHSARSQIIVDWFSDMYKLPKSATIYS